MAVLMVHTVQVLNHFLIRFPQHCLSNGVSCCFLYTFLSLWCYFLKGTLASFTKNSNLYPKDNKVFILFICIHCLCVRTHTKRLLVLQSAILHKKLTLFSSPLFSCITIWSSCFIRNQLYCIISITVLIY
ncbi:hypothetical protein ZEAMMB73_Zm00001d042888 [Zea mays]|uniref:Uncharacterized protein n=1 Tax=Zea mays TaxID=4577 RepID=A0A1D6N7C8_MAIZE|nr:hypothetical protein ZEAMMB73_Zm00001d042888 [Zea mays]